MSDNFRKISTFVQIHIFPKNKKFAIKTKINHQMNAIGMGLKVLTTCTNRRNYEFNVIRCQNRAFFTPTLNFNRVGEGLP